MTGTEQMFYVAFNSITHKPIMHKGAFGPYAPLWDNPIAAEEWAQTTRTMHQDNYYVLAVPLMVGKDPKLH
jgi:hypothetical protein